jgi:hypothetical protein
LGENTRTVKISTEVASLDVGTEVGLEMNSKNPQIRVHVSAPQCTITFLNEPSENVAKFRYLETTVTNQNGVHENVRTN